ncbi:MAG: CIA30 family protein, partial [Rhodospirillaceae bacterium]
DDFRLAPPKAAVGSEWSFVSDRVMGGVSKGTLAPNHLGGRACARMRGAVSLENNGGFIQSALDLTCDGSLVDASHWTGIRLDVFGNDQDYNLHLRSADTQRPWESYRQGFTAGPAWTTIHLPFAGFSAHRTDAPLDLTRLRRIGLVAIGRAFAVDLAVADIRFYSNDV